MKLFYSAGACSLAPHIVLNELGMKYETVAVDLQTKNYKGGNFNTVNPKGYVPVIQFDNGEFLTEAAVILQYLADQKPEANLIPKFGTMERYRCMEWLNFVATEIHKGFGPLWNKETPEVAKTQAKERLAKRFDYLAEHFKKNTYLMGNQYTVADAYLFTLLGWCRFLNYDLSKWPTLMGYEEKVRIRPAVTATLKEEGLLKDMKASS